MHPTKKSMIEKSTKIACRVILFIMGMNFIEIKKNDCQELYSKYLGDDYKLEFENGYSCIASNHFSFIVNY